MAYCKVRQAEIYYEAFGEGKPVLMIHGFAPDHRLMRGCMEPIFTNRDGWRRIYIDLPGMGLTKIYEEHSLYWMQRVTICKLNSRKFLIL